MHQNKSKNTVLFFKNPLWLALLLQAAVLAALSVILPYISHWIIPPYDLGWLVFVQTALVVLLSWFFRMPSWWLWIQAILPVGLFVGLTQHLIPLSWFGIIAIILLFIFSNVWTERVPLYLSNRITHNALAILVAEKKIKTAIDLGSGLGGVVRALARCGVSVLGVEFSPLLALVSNTLCRVSKSGHVIQGDMWQQNLSSYDLVYVFLSPIPMTALWQKAKAEMKSGSILVSNSFAIPDIEPDDVWELADARQTQLFIYKIQ